jgi:hypothetical protein
MLRRHGVWSVGQPSIPIVAAEAEQVERTRRKTWSRTPIRVFIPLQDLETVVLRHQLKVLRRGGRRVLFTTADRAFLAAGSPLGRSLRSVHEGVDSITAPDVPSRNSSTTVVRG